MSHDASTLLGRGAPRGPVRRVLVAMLDDGVVTHELPAAGEVVIGRGQGAGVRIDHPSVSRAHAAIELGERIAVRDLGSANGTSVRGARLPAQRVIEIGANEAVQLGDVVVVVQERRAPSGAPPPTTGARASTEALAFGAPDSFRAGPAPARAIAAVVLDPAMKNLFDLARRVAAGTINVLVIGESGAGKEVLARAIHAASPRARGPLVEVNCAAISESLIESELFGHARGAFTGAVADKAGLLEAADGGTLFLDEIGELSAGAQAKLLRVIEDRRVTRVGETAARAIDVRVIAATHRDLESSGFRTDLYYRIAGIVLDVPPLRERVIEIEPLARAFAAAAAAPLGRPAPDFAPGALAALAAHDWPGNVRELRNAVERAVLLAPGAITAADLFGATPPAPREVPADERARIVAALEQCAGNQTRAAELLGMPRRTLVKRLGQYGIPRPKRG